jgi:DNA-directed RNA polymerase subunit RPC12/RpoP
MATATCPECDAEVEVDEVDADIGDELSCPECGQNLVVSGTEPVELDFADEDEEEDDDESDDDDDDDVDDDEDLDDEDDEREDGDWEE